MRKDVRFVVEYKGQRFIAGTNGTQKDPRTLDEVVSAAAEKGYECAYMQSWQADHYMPHWQQRTIVGQIKNLSPQPFEDFEVNFEARLVLYEGLEP